MYGDRGIMESMKERMIEEISQHLSIKPKQVQIVLDLTAEGATIPFIARYRKDMTGNLDEVVIKSILDLDKSLTALEERKETVLAKIEAQGKLTDALRKEIEEATKLAEVEELYLPYKEKRRTKATAAREAGLSNLTRLVIQNVANLESQAQSFVSEAYPTAGDALQGAVDILTEVLAEDNALRQLAYKEISSHSQISSQVKDESLDEKGVFELYYDFSETIKALKGYQILALNRGEKLGILKVSFEHHLDLIESFFSARFKSHNPYIQEAINQAVKKKVIPAMERRIRSELTERAEEGAIQVFSENLRNLLLIAPLKGRVVLGFDPAFRTGAKLAVVDQTGKMLTTHVIYPVKPASAAKIAQAKVELASLIKEFGVEIIAIGNGTASRESEAFVAEVLQDFTDVSYVIVNEAGASVYSASEMARQEFPELTVEKRSAISIARRLQDPLAELVKIDPKAIGVGQYQHDVSQKHLSESLDFVVETVVNQVGVNVNTASAALLSHVSGLNKTISENIVKFREENGEIKSRTALKKVPRLGAKAFEQAAGFLRVPASKNLLDHTGVHPESYKAVDALLGHLQIKDLDDQARNLLEAADPIALSQELGIGVETLRDMIAELIKPGRDMRDSFDAPVLRTDVLEMKDLKVGQKLEGTVRNVVDFGAFVDVGVHQDGLVHIRKLSKQRVSHPSQVVSVGDIVTVWVDSVDLDRERLGLSMVEPRESN